MTAFGPQFPTVLHALVHHAQSDDNSGISVCVNGDTTFVSYKDLVDAAARSAWELSMANVKKGDRVLLCLPTGPEFLIGFLGAQFIGAIPTAVATPTSIGSGGALGLQFEKLVNYLDPAAVIVSDPSLFEFDHKKLFIGKALYASAINSSVPKYRLDMPSPDDLALIQCTSGSTGHPKGVEISHGNLLSNCSQLTSASSWTQPDKIVSWLPLYHDMGLILGIFCPILMGSNSILMPPTEFLRYPARWLELVSTHKGTISAAPNFAFSYTASRVRDDEMRGVDLASWRWIFCGAEPIHVPTIHTFIERFTKWGFPKNSVVPCYGLAEATLGVTFSENNFPIVFDAIDRDIAVGEMRAVDVDVTSSSAQHVVDCGRPVEGTEVRVVDDHGTELAECRIGNIQFRGLSRTSGYYKLPGETAKCLVIPGGWWNTGDAGYLRNGRLRITGRIKDVIILRGANYFPTEFEQAAQLIGGVHPGGAVAVPVSRGGNEEFHLVVESDLHTKDHAKLRLDIRTVVQMRTGIVPDDVHVLPRKSIPKTTSGKVQRSKVRSMVEKLVTDALAT
jgi:fatty-acyl-CoA synthase